MARHQDFGGGGAVRFLDDCEGGPARREFDVEGGCRGRGGASHEYRPRTCRSPCPMRQARCPSIRFSARSALQPLILPAPIPSLGAVWPLLANAFQPFGKR